MAFKSNLSGIIYPVATGQKWKNGIPASLLELWGRRVRNNLLMESKKFAAIRRILIEAEKEGIILVFFKGCVLADLYPQCLLRNTCDTDIFVYEKDREKAMKLLEGLGYIKSEEHSKKHVQVLFSNEFHHVVELHFYLWEDYKGRKIDILTKMDLVKDDSLQELEVCKMKVITLGYEEHLIYQMFHIIKHFVTEGVGIRYLTDVALYINRYGALIDYSSFWEKMKQLGFDKFCQAFFRLCIQCFDMKEDIMKAVKPMNNGIEDALLIDILNLGVLYKNKTSSWQILGIMTPYLVGDEYIPENSFMRKLKVLFPARKSLPDEFSYAKKYVLLLPVAWIHKMILFLIKSNKYKGWYNAGEKLETAEYRLKLVKKLGLAEK